MSQRKAGAFFFITAWILGAVLIIVRTASFSCADEEGSTSSPRLTALSVQEILFFDDEGTSVAGGAETSGDEPSGDPTAVEYPYEERMVILAETDDGKRETFYGFERFRALYEDAFLTENSDDSVSPSDTGERRFTLTAEGISTEFKVKILKRTISEISPKSPVRLTYSAKGEGYDLSGLALVVHYENTDLTEEILLSDTENDASGSQESEPWEEGSHTVSFTYRDYTGSFDALVTKTPVSDWNFTEDAFWTTEKEHCAADEEGELLVPYVYLPEAFLKIRLIQNDGSAFTGTLKEIETKFGEGAEITLPDGSAAMLLETGKPSLLKVKLFDIEKSVTVTVSEKKSSECAHEHTEELTEIPADCHHGGRTAGERCLDCGKILSGGRSTPLVSHQASSFRLLSAPNCENKGRIQYVCTVCGETVNADIPAAGHRYGPYTVVKEATENEDGLQKAVCMICGKEIEEVLPMTGSSAESESASGDKTSEKSEEESTEKESQETKRTEESSEEESGSEASSESAETSSSEGKAEGETKSRETTEKKEPSASRTREAKTSETERRTAPPSPPPPPTYTQPTEKKGSEREPIEVDIRTFDGEEKETEGTEEPTYRTEEPSGSESEEYSIPPVDQELAQIEKTKSIIELILIGTGLIGGAFFLAWILFLLISRFMKKKK